MSTSISRMGQCGENLLETLGVDTLLMSISATTWGKIWIAGSDLRIGMQSVDDDDDDGQSSQEW